MGQAATGSLTWGQFLKLQEAARNIDEMQVKVAPGKFVRRYDNGDVVSALGTGVMNDLANPININRMFCAKSEGTCEMSGAEFDELDVLAAARLCIGATKVRGRLCVKRCGPSYRRTQNASVVLENFGRHPKKTFSTLSALNGLALMSAGCPLSGVKRKSASATSTSANDSRLNRSTQHRH